jgi:hypothetical protein
MAAEGHDGGVLAQEDRRGRRSGGVPEVVTEILQRLTKLDYGNLGDGVLDHALRVF